MRLIQYIVMTVGVLAVNSGAVAAGLCETPFMHDGGQVQLVGSGGLQLGADLAFSEVKKSGVDACEARVRGESTFGLAGLPASKSSIDYWMKVKNGKATFERLGNGGQRVPVNGKFDLRMVGLFAYGDPVARAGQTFPALRYQINVDNKAVQTQPVVVQTGQKTVGERQKIQTAAGSRSCWPVRYTRKIEPTQASFNGLVLPIPGMTSSVTDWLCPDLNMVMRQDSKQNGVTSVVEVTKVQ